MSAVENEIAALAEKFARNPTSRIFAPLADAYRRAGRIDEAIDVCQRGLRHHPDYLSGQLVLARTYYDRGDLDMAANVFRQVLAGDARNLIALRALGEIAQAREDSAGAIAWYERALEVEPANPELQERLEGLRSAETLRDAGLTETSAESAEAAAHIPAPAADKAYDVAERRVEEPVEEIATVTLAEIYADQGLHARALAIYRRILAEDPGNPIIREKAERLEAELGEEADVAGADAGRFERAAPPRPEPWAFLLEDEVDQDPDDVFGPARATVPGSRGDNADRGEEAWLRPAERRARTSGAAAEDREAGVAEPAGVDAGLVDDQDLKKFQEWLRSLK